MKRAIFLGAICLLILAPAVAEGQELSTDVFPSEDELLEALVLGDIDYDQYILLLDIAQHGVDSTDLHLLDQIPNLTSLSSRVGTSRLESDQHQLFTAANESKRSSVRYGYYQTLDSREQSRYRIDGRLRLSEQWTGRLAVRKDVSGRERFVDRSLVFKQDHSLVRKLVIGTITERYGLGSIIGYRGKLLHYDDRLTGESFFFPDNGGFNGVAINLQPRGWRIRSLAAYTRDSATNFGTLAGMAERTGGSIRPYVTIGLSRLSNRASGKRLEDVKLAGGFTSKYTDGNAGVEYCVQTDAERTSGAFLAEGTHQLSGTRLEYAGWRYGDNFVDLTTGGKAADIRTQFDFPELDFTLRSKRAGQQGVQLKAESDLCPDMRLMNSVILAERNADSTNFQWLQGLERDLTRQLSFRIDYLHSQKERDNTRGEDDRYTRRFRFETRFTADRMKIRTYLAFSSTSSYGDYVSLFTSAKFNINSAMQGEVWSNVSRIAQGSIDYWYLYAKLDQQLTAEFSLAAKLSHRYNRRASIRNSSAVSLEIEAAW